MAFEQLEAPAAPDAVGDPRADQRAEQRRRATIPIIVRWWCAPLPARVGDGEAGEQHHDLGGDRDAGAISATISTKIARQPGVADEVRGFVDERFGDRGEDEHGAGRYRGVGLHARGAPPASAASSIAAAPGRRNTVPAMRVWIDLTNSPHVLVMRPVIERLRADGHEVRVTARDFAQTLALCERFGIEHTRDRPPPRRAAGGEGARACVALGGARALGSRGARAAGGQALRHRARPRLQRRDGRGGAAARAELDDVRLRVGDGAAQRQLPPGARGRRARRDPAASACTATARAASCARTRASRRSTTWRTSSPTTRCSTSWRSIAQRPIVVVRTPPEVSLYHRFENDLFARVLERLREAAAQRRACSRSCCRAWTRSARSWRGVPGFVVPERAIDAQSLIAYADLVISAGGTMNREAVALGVPVYTTFEGRPGAVDERLIAEGRLRRLSAAGELDLGRARARRSASARVRRDPRVLVELLLTPLAGWRSSAPERASGRLQSRECADGSARRPSPCTVTRCPSSRWMGHWSRSRTTSPSSCASTTARHGYYAAPARTHDLVGARGEPAGARARARLPAPLALLGPARLRGGRARGASRSCC